MFNMIIEETKCVKAFENAYGENGKKFIGLFIGGKDRGFIKGNNGDTYCERQMLFMALAGLSFTFMTAASGSSIGSKIGISVLGILFAVVLGAIGGLTISVSDKSEVFSAVKSNYWAPQNELKSTVFSLSMLINATYISSRGAEFLASFIMSPAIAKAAGFVMASLLLIHPSKVGRNVSTISGFMGFVTFCLCAAAIYLTNSQSSTIAISLLKILPIFIACTEAISEERKSKATTPYRLLSSCLLGSALLTTAFVGSDCLTQKFSSMLSNPGLFNSAMKLTTEVLLTPACIIAASFLCTKMCNTIDNNSRIAYEPV